MIFLLIYFIFDESGCPELDIIDKRSETKKDVTGSSILTPQKVTLTLRKNDPTDITFEFKRPKTYPGTV
jgi:hypothetical protein